jgi:hypothetical protein
MLGEQTGSGDIADHGRNRQHSELCSDTFGVSGSMTVPVIVVGLATFRCLCGWSCSPREALTDNLVVLCDYPHATGGSLTMCSVHVAAYAATALADGVIVPYEASRWCDRRKVMLKSEPTQHRVGSDCRHSLLDVRKLLRFNWAYLHNPAIRHCLRNGGLYGDIPAMSRV